MKTKELFSFFPFFLFSLLLMSSCGGQSIPERKLVKILAEIHLTDAALEKSGELQWNDKMRDSTAVYTAILDEYGYTVGQLYRSVQTRCTTKEEADELYGKVYKRLSKLQKKYAKEVEKLHAAQNRWTQKSTWRFPRDGDTSRLDFTLPVSDSAGSYILNANIALLAADSVSNPRITMYLYAQNCRTISLLRDSLSVDTLICTDSLIATAEQPLERNGKEQNYTLTLKNTSAHATLVQGYILNCDNDSLRLNPRHAMVSNITLRYVAPSESSNKKVEKRTKILQREKHHVIASGFSEAIP